MGDAESMETESSASAVSNEAAARKRKRSAQGCVCEENDVLVEELKKVKAKVRDPTSHLASNYARAISSIMHHDAPVRDGKQAKQLRNIGNYLANQIQAILQKKGLLLRAASSDSSNSASESAINHLQRVHKQHKQVAARKQSASVAASTTPAAASATQAISQIAPIATRVSSEAAHKEYAPAYKKQPWYVILAMGDERATSESTAIAVETLLRKLQSAGYDGNMVKLKTAIASLCGTHEVVSKTSAGLLYLTAKGRRSLQLCPGKLPSPDEARPSSHGSALAAAAPVIPIAVSSVPSQPPQPAPVVRQTLTNPSPAIAPGAPASRAATVNTNVVCIDLSDSEDEVVHNGRDFGDDSVASEDESARACASSSPVPSQDDDDDTFSFEYEPDEEPPSVLHSQSQSCGTRAQSESNAGMFTASDEWELVLILDHREILSRQNRDILERKLLERNVTCEVRALNVGDVQWIAKRHRSGEVHEFVLNAIVERKEVRDLSGSIIDRRYTEQKIRLRASGLTHIIYLVEGSFAQQTTVRSGGLQTALCRTQVQNQFFVQVCENADETVAFLAAVHTRLLAKFPRERCRNPEARGSLQLPLPSSSTRLPMQATQRQFEQIFCHPAQSFTTFNSLFRKKAQFTVSEIYQMMLTQVPGLSAAKAAGVSAAYPTFRELRQALLSHESKKKDERVENIRCGESQRRLGVKSRESLSYLLTSAVYSDSDEAAAAAVAQE